MEYILNYLKEERFITFMPNVNIEYKEEFADNYIPIGYRLIVNGKDIDVVVWYADYIKWIEEKYQKRVSI